MPDGILTRCGKESRALEGDWPPPINQPEVESCSLFIPYDSTRPKWEWDEKKNKINSEKHGIDFNEAVQACDADPKALRIPAPKPDTQWEKLEGLNFDELGIDKNKGNLDPVRDWYLFSHWDKVWKMVTTLRGEQGLMTQRIISVHRAKPDEEELYKTGFQ
ncbi:BrnT family toxin [Sulfuricurvum sp. IAE1]|uniref:BrnT family toxin n=1 Tax=Sulfuricurvum sp. IAE1 TaxID=2546102 RepID=UPI0014054722|nr:BrnT family toxin [Sulfuricurvum sp. IAE1]